MLYLNSQGFCNKKDDIIKLVNDTRPNVLCLAETHTHAEITEHELKIKGYKTFRCDTKNKRTGGLLLYVKSNLNATKVEEIYYENYFWLLSINVKIKEKNFLIAVLYHAPQQNENLFINHVEEFLDRNSDF